MENKIAVVTGASKGIGKAIADQLKMDGYLVITIARHKPSENTHLFYAGDVSSLKEMDAILEDIYQKYGQIDVLVNNAGITKDNLMLRMSLEDFNEVLNVNLVSAFYLSKQVSKHMLKKRSGRIINIASISGLRGNPGQANYAAAKAALISLTQTMAKEFGSRNILVNAVAPGFIETAMTDKLPDDFKNKVKERIPLGRFGKPEEIADVVSFLASEKANYITGQVITVCGGMSL